jgi:hypothetical protein
MPYGSGWTGAQFSTPASGSSAGSVYSLASGGGNTNAAVPQQAAGAPSWSAGLMSNNMQQGLVLAALVIFLAAWHAHGFSLIE